MKRTTYILIGLFVAGLCVLVGGMFMIFCWRILFWKCSLQKKGRICFLARRR